MKRGLFLGVVLILGMGTFWGAVFKANSSTGPAITQSFASKEIRPGDTWKIYINASDPTGKMKYIYAEVQQAGRGVYPVSMTRIKPENRKEFSGYLYLNTFNAAKAMVFVSVRLVVHLGDGAGNFSEPKIFPLEFYPRAVQASPPAGVFEEKNLGPIMIQLRPASDDGDNDTFEK